MKGWFLTAVFAGLVGCVAGKQAERPQAKGPTLVAKKSPAPAEEKNSGDAVVAALPTSVSCGASSECLPPDAFARSTCAGRFPGLALKMFEKDSPWRRLYFKGQRTVAVNTRGGATGDPFEPGEEVLLIRRHGGGPDGMTVSGSEVDVLRWDGTCATLPGEYLAERSPSSVHEATISWRYLDEITSEALLGVQTVQAKRSEQRNLCKGSPASKPTPPCAQASLSLSRTIIRALREGLQLPEPALLPEWNIQE
jgi:hypothetical protein